MFRSDSPFGNDTSSYAGSMQSRDYSTMDEVSSQLSGLSRPSAKSIYLQRKEYATSINKMMDKFQYRVEHLFSCDLDGKELRSVADCVERLNLLDGMGRVWGQNMLLEVRGGHLALTDMETREALESVSLGDVLEVKAVVDGGAFNSLLTVSVKSVRKKATTVFMFQCDDVRADHVQRNLSRALSRRKEEPSSSTNTNHEAKNQRNAATTPKPTKPEPPGRAVPQWTAPESEEDDFLHPETAADEDDEEEEASTLRHEVPSPPFFITDEDEMLPTRPYTELDRNVDLLNHTLSDIEIFVGQVSAVVAKNAKKKNKNKKGKAVEGMPSAEDFSACLRKVKFALNLLGELKGNINNPSAPEFVHSLFSTLGFVVFYCPAALPPTIVAPLLSPLSIQLLSEEATAEEDQLWQSLGDAWNIPSTQWPDDDDDIPEYLPVFSDGWQPPDVTEAPAHSEPQSRGSPQPAPEQIPAKWKPPPSPLTDRFIPGELKPRRMRVTQDFVSRNRRELTIRKGEIVELLDKSKQWWKVRNSKGEEGFVPNNVLEAHNGQASEQSVEEAVGSPVLTKKSKPADVKAWLEEKGFSKITVRCLGVLSGSMLLGMTREELKSVCPEEGGRVFFQVQAVRASMAAAS